MPTRSVKRTFLTRRDGTRCLVSRGGAGGELSKVPF